MLAVNAGSSSLKLRVIGDSDEVAAAADDVDIASFVAGIEGIDAVGHRVVHGGDRYRQATRIDDDVRAGIEALTPLAPLHQTAALKGIDAAAEALPGVPAVACFDTAFHATLPLAAATYALPRAWNEQWGLRRYGFHGLSHAWAARRGATLVARPVEELRIVTCHLGAGSSCCAVKGGRSVDTTMGFTPLEGLVMATRSGTVDPGLIAWLIDHAGLAAADVATALEDKSGLAGLTGGSGDMREVVAAAAGGDTAAQLALDVWTHRLRGAIAAMAAAAGGIDLLVFTGGIGEHQPDRRATVCAGLDWLGLAVDPSANDTTTDAIVSPPGATVTVAVVTAREDIEIANEVRALLER
ncbi:MAG TPA: acetate/propionate family kinase [Acidimicrobiales bacterium]|nr:acetate/propionate family kinase [Acidimicrobiales bacterium]